MNISQVAKEIMELVQLGLADKTNPVKINRQVTATLNKLIKSISETNIDEEAIVVVDMDAGVPKSISTNIPGLNNAKFVCLDDIAVIDEEDEENAIIVEDDRVVINAGEIELFCNGDIFIKAMNKFTYSRDN